MMSIRRAVVALSRRAVRCYRIERCGPEDVHIRNRSATRSGGSQTRLATVNASRVIIRVKTFLTSSFITVQNLVVCHSVRAHV